MLINVIPKYMNPSYYLMQLKGCQQRIPSTLIVNRWNITHTHTHIYIYIYIYSKYGENYGPFSFTLGWRIFFLIQPIITITSHAF
jgi:hypothetical protein